MARLIEDHPTTVQTQEAGEIEQILTETLTIAVRGERNGEPEWAEYTEPEILRIANELKMLSIDLYKVRSAIERRRGDHDVHESDFKA